MSSLERITVGFFHYQITKFFSYSLKSGFLLCKYSSVCSNQQNIKLFHCRYPLELHAIILPILYVFFLSQWTLMQSKNPILQCHWLHLGKMQLNSSIKRGVIIRRLLVIIRRFIQERVTNWHFILWWLSTKKSLSIFQEHISAFLEQISEKNFFFPKKYTHL